MNHVVLLGDSIFDNAHYVPGGPPVIEQLRKTLPEGWLATLLAIDGNVTSDVTRQLQKLEPDASHLVISVGGNDALQQSFILAQPVQSIRDAMVHLATISARFQTTYRQMLAEVLSHRLPTIVCTIYDAIPNLGDAEKAALSHFNDVILQEAISAGIPVIDLRSVCNEATDYSQVSPIEPSVHGGEKIVQAVATAIRQHDFKAGKCTIYSTCSNSISLMQVN